MQFLKEYKRYIHLDTIHSRNLKFGMYLHCITLHKSNVAILKISYFGHFIGKNVPKVAVILDFWSFFRNRYIRFVKRHKRKLHTKFQVPSMYGVQINVTCVHFRNRALKFLCR